MAATGNGMTASVIALVFVVLVYGVFIYIIVLLIKALRKYLRSTDARKERSVIKKGLGETLRTYRTNCKMTQEFVAESLGVSRQAVSKWENGSSDPSTSNLFALAKLFGVSVEELLSEVK